VQASVLKIRAYDCDDKAGAILRVLSYLRKRISDSDSAFHELRHFPGLAF
jgi:hypothetical protein